ncbi:MAG TPA: 50S ribosomal protein L23 [Pyrinomonadaceae bacterium]|nr:50S ribosomal protein L23 [Chloracidobacterium sp.]MBP9934565.1 50S ribosomal protein L23 [Pyrinomonadaceae bacterium]MBK7802435.1 50S ribosomal protein L23 [Chloracidobacterium sp.]MBK9437304.1 50S ribosomal protein L23 [Chloracidobacterium sp.]MBL0239977.1 50S ribosomal protein L23 [Chloracidobacterium sp.]
MSSLGVWDILKSPVITEKSVILKEDSTEENDTRKQGQVLTFRVDKKANKIAIKAAVEEIFNVKVAAVRTIQYDGKVKKRGRIEGRRPGFKKAYVTLRKGEPMVDYAEAI